VKTIAYCPTKTHSRPIKQDFIFSESLNCNKFGQLILRKINKIVATRCHILRLKFTKFDFVWGSTPDPGFPCLLESLGFFFLKIPGPGNFVPGKSWKLKLT